MIASIPEECHRLLPGVAGLGAYGRIDHVVFYEKPFLKFERLLETYLAVAPAGFRSFVMAMPLWIHEKLRLPGEMGRGLGGDYTKRYVFPEHHESHRRERFLPSAFDEAAIPTCNSTVWVSGPRRRWATEGATRSP